MIAKAAHSKSSRIFSIVCACPKAAAESRNLLPRRGIKQVMKLDPQGLRRASMGLYGYVPVLPYNPENNPMYIIP